MAVPDGLRIWLTGNGIHIPASRTEHDLRIGQPSQS